MNVPAGWTPDPVKVAAYIAGERAAIAGLEYFHETLDRAASDAWRVLLTRRQQLEAFEVLVAKHTPPTGGTEHPQSGPPPAEEGAPTAH